MADFRERYKRVGFGREDIEVNRVLRSQRRDEARRELRSEHFSLKRDLDDIQDDHFDEKSGNDASNKSPSPKPSEDKKKKPTELEAAVQQRLLELEKWQKERQRKKLAEKKKLKPVFKVGVVHHRIYSPPINKEPAPLPPPKLCKSKEIKQEERPKKVTRATEKRLAAKAVANHQKREDVRNKKKIQQQDVTEVKSIPFAPKDHQFKAPEGVFPLPMFGRYIVEESKDNKKSNSVSGESHISEFGKSISDLSDSVFDSNLSSSTKATIKNSTFKNPVTLCDSTTHENDNFSTNSSLVLKLSSDDQETLSDQEKIPCSNEANNSLTPKSSTSHGSFKSKLSITQSSLMSEESKKVTSDSQMMEDMHNGTSNKDETLINSSTNLTSKQKLYGLRSTKALEGQKAQSEKLKNSSFMSINQEMDNVESIDLKDISCSSSKTILDESISTKFNKITVAFNNSATKSQSMLDNLNIIDSKLKSTILNSPVPDSKNKTTLNRRRSTRVLRSNSDENKSIDTVTASVQLEKLNQEKDKSIDHPEEISSSTSESSIINSKLSESNKKMSLVTRKSCRVVKTGYTEESTKQDSLVNDIKLNASINVKPEVADTLATKDNSLTDSSPSKQSRKLMSKQKRSSRVFNDENLLIDAPSKKSSSMIEDKEIEAGRKSTLDLANKHLLDITLSDLNNLKSTKSKRRINVVNEQPLQDIQDQSLIKFSPRQSIRLQNEKLKQESERGVKPLQNSLIEKSPTQSDTISLKNNELPILIVEDIKQKTLDIPLNDSQNFSLNLTLSEESLTDKPPAFYSPFVVTSRGKNNVRKELQRKRLSQRINEDVPTKDTVMQSLNISVEEEERTSQYYKYLLDKEIERLNAACESWNVIKEDGSTPEDVQYLIQAAVGQTQLLINKKFQRFRSLVLDCETGKGEMLVTCKDLQGFWEMMYMEIKDVDGRFNKLEELKAKNWVEEKEEKSEVKPKKKLVKKAPAKKKPAPAKSSSLRAHIMAARKKLENKESEEMDVDVDVKQLATNEQQNVDAENKKIKNTPINKRRTSTPKSINKRQSIMNDMHNRNSMPSPLIAMKLSQMCKTPEVRLDDSIHYINSSRTPAKGILKPKLNSCSVVKSTNKVFFKEQPLEIQEFETDKDVDGASSILEEDKVTIERRLDFESDSFNSSHADLEEKKQNEKAAEYRHELFLSKDGTVSERYTPVEKDTPKTKRLKRSNSDRLSKSTKIENDTSNTIDVAPTTLRLSRRVSQMSKTITSDSSPVDLINSNTKLITPRTRRSLKRTTTDAELSENSEGTPTEGASPVKIIKRTSKISRTLNSTNISDGTEKSDNRKPRRTKSLNAADCVPTEIVSDYQPKKRNLRSTNVKINLSAENSEKPVTPRSKRKSLKEK